MTTAADTEDLDSLDRLPLTNRISIALVLAVAGLNAFNDNILKMMLVGLAPKVSEGALGQDIGSLLGGIILIPYIVLAPVAGYFSDRFSKRRVILAMLAAQAVILSAAGIVLASEPGQSGVAVALVIFFTLAIQSTLFSPAKFGILKEICGSKRLGMVAGWLQMITMLGILGGLWIGGEWFDWLYARLGNPWKAAAYPIWILLGVSVVAMFAGWKIQPVAAAGHVAFRASMLWRHFHELAETLRTPSLRRACFGNATYWFVASMVGAMFVDIGIALFPDTASAGAASASSRLTLLVGLGTAGGSVFASWVNRRGLQLGLIPIGALGMSSALFLSGVAPLGSTLFDVAMAAVGFAGGCYLVPIQAFIQDRAPAERRGQVISGVNLMDSLAGILAVTLLVGIKSVGGSFAVQFMFLGVLMLIATIYIVKLLPQDLLRLVVLGIVRSIYKVKAIGEENMPAAGGVLLLPNHVSYVDALVLSAASPRPVRFVMWDVLYRLWWLKPLLKFVGTVPISPTRAKDAIRTVATALKDGQVVCLFPEGQITRHGMVNELRKGYELMARQGHADVQVVYMDGLYGSIFSFEGGTCFRKWPKKLRYPVAIHFSEPKGAKAATLPIVRETMLRLAADAFVERQRSASHAVEPAAAVVNAIRLLDIECLPPKGGTLVCDDDDPEIVHQTLRCITRLRPQWQFTTIQPTHGDIVRVTTKHETNEGSVCPRLHLLWVSETELSGTPPDQLIGWIDAASGVLVSQNIPDPLMPPEETGNQLGQRTSSLGRLLPGLSCQVGVDHLTIGRLAQGIDSTIELEGWTLDSHGFIVRTERTDGSDA